MQQPYSEKEVLADALTAEKQQRIITTHLQMNVCMRMSEMQS